MQAPLFAYGKQKEDKHCVLYPDHTFAGWPVVNLPSWQDVWSVLCLLHLHSQHKLHLIKGSYLACMLISYPQEHSFHRYRWEICELFPGHFEGAVSMVERSKDNAWQLCQVILILQHDACEILTIATQCIAGISWKGSSNMPGAAE